MFTNDVGRGLINATVTTRFQQMLRNAGLPRERFHDLRLGAATLLLQDGVPLERVRQILGHSSVATTADIYGHVTAEDGREALERLSKRLGGSE